MAREVSIVDRVEEAAEAVVKVAVTVLLMLLYVVVIASIVHQVSSTTIKEHKPQPTPLGFCEQHKMQQAVVYEDRCIKRIGRTIAYYVTKDEIRRNKREATQ